MREVPGRVVWPISDGAVHTVCSYLLRAARTSSADLLVRALTNAQAGPFRVYSTGDLPDVYEDSFMAVARPDGQTFVPTLILVGTRLGIDKVNTVYWRRSRPHSRCPSPLALLGESPHPAAE